MALGGVGGGAVRVGAGGSRQGSPKINRRPSSSFSHEKEYVSKLSELPIDILSNVTSHLRAADLNIFAQVNVKFNKATYSERHNKVFHLDLEKYETVDEIKTILEKLTYLDKIKITGLNKNGKLELFKEALSKLNNATFNTIQCDCSGNKLTDDQFKEINTVLLSKMKRLTSLDLYNNKIGAEGATAIAENLTKLTWLNLGNNNIGDAGATAIATNLTNLISLSLHSNNIGDAGATAIAEHLTNLTSLDLCNNNIGDAGATAIATNLTILTLA